MKKAALRIALILISFNFLFIISGCGDKENDPCVKINCVNGICLEGKCICEAGWQGSDCQFVKFPKTVLWQNCRILVPNPPVETFWDDPGSEQWPDLKLAFFAGKDYILDGLTIKDADATILLSNDFTEKEYEDVNFSIEVPSSKFYSVALFDTDGTKHELMELVYFYFDFSNNNPEPFSNYQFGYGIFNNGNFTFSKMAYTFN